jgi:rod shape-determining protein MreC
VLLYFALLQGIALTFYFTFISFPRAQWMTTASTVTGTMLEYRNDITKHFNLSKNNTWLQTENIRLRNMLKQSRISMENKTGNDSSLVRINDTLWKQQYDFVAATIINSTYDKRNNYFTLNVGKAQGVERGMGVFRDDGVIGVVHNSNTHYSVVKSCLTKDINVDVLIEGSGEFGILKWDGKDPRYGSMTGVSNDLTIKKGSKVITRGGAGIYPRGIPVGVITKTEVVEGQPLWDITVKFSVDFRKVQRAYVIKNLLRDEQKDLEANVPTEE